MDKINIHRGVYRLLALFLFTTFNSFSQDLEKLKIWTLEVCIQYALKKNIQIQKSELTLESTRTYYDQSKAAFLPSVNGQANHYINFGRAIDYSTNTFADNTQNGSLGIYANLNLLSGLQNQNTLRMYKWQHKADMASLEQAKYDLSLNIATYYLDILLNHELLESAKIQLQTSREQIARTEKLVKAGAQAEYSLVEVKAQSAAEGLNVTKAENNLNLARLTLLQALLLRANTKFEIETPVVPPFDSIDSELDTETVYRLALSTQPGIKSLKYRIVSARYEEWAAKGYYFPTLTIGGGISSTYSSQASRIIDTVNTNYIFEKTPYADQLKSNKGQYVGFNLTIPVFNNYRSKTQVQLAKINKKMAEINEAEVKNLLRQNIEMASLNAKSAATTYTTSLNQVDHLKESYRVAEKRFNVGAITSLDYTISKNKLNQAESDLIRSKYDYIFRLKILDFYQNKPLTLAIN